MSESIVVQASVVCDDQNSAVKAMEALSRVAVGLAIDGIHINISAGTVEVEDEE